MESDYCATMACQDVSPDIFQDQHLPGKPTHPCQGAPAGGMHSSLHRWDERENDISLPYMMLQGYFLRQTRGNAIDMECFET